jgi:triphosphatase
MCRYFRCLDLGTTVSDGSRRQTEIEVAIPGTLSQLQPVIDELTVVCQTTRRDLSQLRSTLALADMTPQSTLNLGPTQLNPDVTTGEYAYARLRGLFGEFLDHEPGTKLGDDPEELHQMRVATRRLRAAIGLFQPALAPGFQDLRQELRWIAAVLGDARDLQVQEASLGHTLDACEEDERAALSPLVGYLKADAGRAQENVVQALESPRYQSLVQAMTTALRQGPDSGDDASLAVSVFAARSLRASFRSVRKQASRITPDSPDEALHKLRIKAKRLRYAAETFQPLFGPRTRVMIQRSKALQDLLGEHRDRAFARQWLRENALRGAASLPPQTLLQAGVLIERYRLEMDQLRGQWEASYKRVRKAWKRMKKEMKSSLRIVAIGFVEPDDPGPDSAPTA